MHVRSVAFVAALLVLSAVCAYAEYLAHVDRQIRTACAQRRAVLLRHFEEHQRQRQHAMTKARQTQVLRDLETLSSPTQSWTAWMDAAALYATGSFPDYAPNPQLAAALYHAIAVTCETPAIANHARALVTDMPVRDPDDIEGAPLPTPPGEHLLKHITHLARTRSTLPPPAQNTRSVMPITETVAVPPTIPTIRNDPQNAHDHGVVASLKSTLETLPRGDDAARTRDAVERALFEDGIEMNDETKAKALAVLHSLRDDHRHSGFGVTELEALDRVWTKIGSLGNDIKPNAIETLGKQLASAHERGTMVCSTGKIARVVGTLDGIAHDTSLKPIWAVRDELGTLAAQVRSTALENASPDQRAAYARGDAPDLENTMRDEFTQKAFASYCDSLGMSKKIVTSLVEPFADAF